MNEIIVANNDSRMSVADTVDQVQQIQHLMKEVMISGEHFGVIPGCGNKPSLLQPGAQKLALMFGFAAKYDIEKTIEPGGHREYEITCELVSRNTGTIVGQGVGVCTTMEGKFRYRSENTGNPVPPEYWDTRDRSLLGGSGYSPRKNNGAWFIHHQVDHDNPADYYNTVKKMAKKRAFVDAVLTATAAADIFTQDIEDMPEVFNSEGSNAETQNQASVQESSSPPRRKSGASINKEAQSKPESAKSKDVWDDVQQDVTSIVVDRVEEFRQKGTDGNEVEDGWILYLIVSSDGEKYSTFDKKIYEEAQAHANESEAVTIEYKEMKGKKRITGYNTIKF